MKKAALLLLPAAFAVSPAPAAQSAPSAWSAPELIPTREIGTPTPARPPVFDADGDAFLVWTEARLSIKESISVEYLVRTSMRPVGGRWQPAETLSSLGLNPAVAVDPRGDEIAAWQDPFGLQVAVRRAGRSWLAPQTVATPSRGEPQIASNASGDAIIVAQRQGHGRSTGIRAVLRPSGAHTFSPAQAISAPDNDFEPRMSMNARGDTVAALVREPGHGCFVEAAFRPANGRWSRPRTLSDAHTSCEEDHHVAIDDHGDAVVTWLSQRGRTQFVESASHSRPSGGRWQKPYTVSAHERVDPGAEGGLAALDARGDAMVTWQNHDAS